MRELPILFSTMMVQANMEDRKGMTRRLIKWPKVPEWHDWDYEPDTVERRGSGLWWPMWCHRRGSKVISGLVKCPYGQPGDILWVRETFLTRTPKGEMGKYGYKADFKHSWKGPLKWKPSIFMPKEAARIWLQVTDVRIEHLKDISEEDAIAEGIEKRPGSTNQTRFDYKHYEYGTFDVSAQVSFRTLWQKINGADSWQANPWVWVIKYKILSKTGKPVDGWAPSHGLVT